MNWIDFNIICVGEKIPKILKNDVYSTEVMNRNYNKSQKCYVDEWELLNRIQGIWYEFWSKSERYDFLINSEWESPELVDDNELSLDHGYRLYLNLDGGNIIEELIRFYVKQSPIKQVIVLFRHQGYEKERFYNKLSVEEFLSMFDKRKIYGNIAYIVGE